ncbi:MAG: lysophospholipid acyltransferase family protein [Acidimicrobiia bacterium]|nr:lysophospholipid acyltransferase family protein [Acidimicrobiia bacterium]
MAWTVALPPARLIARLGWRLRVSGEVPLPAGPVILAANHLSHLDGPMVAVAADRPVRFLAVDGLWRAHRWLNVFLRTFGMIPISRERAPLGAMRTAYEHLRAGGSIGVFPEGGVVDGWGRVEPNASVAWLSLKSGSPIVPVAVIGTGEAYGKGATRLRRSRVTVVVGTPLMPADFSDRDDPAAAMLTAWTDWVGRQLAGG